MAKFRVLVTFLDGQTEDVGCIKSTIEEGVLGMMISEKQAFYVPLQALQSFTVTQEP